MFKNFFFSENRAVYEIMSKYLMEPERQEITIQYDACDLLAG